MVLPLLMGDWYDPHDNQQDPDVHLHHDVLSEPDHP